MHTAIAVLESMSPYSQSRFHNEPKKEKESADDYEKRTWRSRLHTDDDGRVLIPPMAFKNCLSEAAKFIGKQIPGKGKSTYTKHFEAGVLCMEHLTLPVKSSDVNGEWFFVPADGQRGSGKRVMKCFPVIPKWLGEVRFDIFDDTITEDVFRQHLEEAGKFIGIGRFRPRNQGSRDLRHIRKSTRKGLRRQTTLVPSSATLPPEDRARHGMLMSYLGMLDVATRPSAQKAIEIKIQQASRTLPPAEMMALFGSKSGDR